MGLLSLECEGGGEGGVGGGGASDGHCYCILHRWVLFYFLIVQSNQEHREGQKLFSRKNLNNQPWPESELSTITDKCRVAPMDGCKYREAGCPSGGWNAYIVLRRSSVQFQP